MAPRWWSNARPLAVGALLAAGASLHAAQAQGKQPANAKASRACVALDTTASWFRRQREWLDESTPAWTNAALRAELLGVSTSARSGSRGALLGYELTGDAAGALTPNDSAIVARLKALAAERGSIWPTRSVVGPSGVLAVWSLAARDSVLARVALKRMMEAGPEESPPAAVAILEDRQRLRAGRKQLYGTQLRAGANGALEPLPIEDELHLALRRDGAELPPLAQSLCAARSPMKP